MSHSLCSIPRRTRAFTTQVINIERVWIAAAPMDMRAGTDPALTRVVKVFGVAHPNHAYLFANRRATRIYVLVQDGLGSG